jgi:hypothetical protein
LLPPITQKLTKYLLGVAFVVNVGRIEKIDPISQAAIDHTAGGVRIGLRSERHVSEAEA